MASGTLSQSEIDRLLGGASNLPFAGPNEESPVQMYDFRRPHRVSKERLRTLEAIYERLVKSLESWVIGRVRGQIEMRLQGVEQGIGSDRLVAVPYQLQHRAAQFREARALDGAQRVGAVEGFLDAMVVIVPGFRKSAIGCHQL